MDTVITNPETLAATTAQQIAEMMGHYIDQQGHCYCALSGGSSPKPLLAELALLPLAWSKVTIVMVDERWTSKPADQNQTMMAEFLSLIEGPKPKFQPLLIEQEFQANLDRCRKLAKTLPAQLDIVVLGMGMDGHTASLFPDAREYPEAMESSDRYLTVTPTQAPYRRISMSFHWIEKAKHLLLYIPGEEKLQCLNSIMDTPDWVSPIKTLAHTAGEKFTIYSSKG